MAKGRILAIDDEKFFRRFYQDLLGSEGYQVRTAASGEEALELVRSEEFDLVITDMNMPGMDGVETTEQILRFNPDQDVMVVSSQQDVEKAVAAMKSGVSEYLLKPINPEEFLHLIGRVLFRQAIKQEHGKLVSENIEFNAILAAYRKCLSFLNVFDLDRLCDLILDNLMELLRAEGGVLWLAEEERMNFRHHCHRGLAQPGNSEESLRPDEQAEKKLLAGEPSLSGDGRKIRIPLIWENSPLALIRIEAPIGRQAFNRTDLKVASAAAEFAVSALHAALRYQAMERKSLRADRGGAYHMAFFRDYLERELQKARRYGRNVSLLRFRIPDYAKLRLTFREKEVEGGMEQLLARVQGVLRDPDVMAMAAPYDYYVLLPETDFWGALMTQKRIRRVLKGLAVTGMRKSQAVEVQLRGASVPADGLTFDELSASLLERLEGLEKSLVRRFSLEELPFWSVVERLLGEEADCRRQGDGLKVSGPLGGFEDDVVSRYFCMPHTRLDEILRSFTREAAESHDTRGIIYRGCDNFDQMQRSLTLVEEQERSATTLYLLGGDRRVHWDYHHTVPIYIEDQHFQEIQFLLYLSEDQAYALFARRRGEELVGFHSADFYFVEHMIAKLQERYRLQDTI